jgi:PAS domain S-box-containing protein
MTIETETSDVVVRDGDRLRASGPGTRPGRLLADTAFRLHPSRTADAADPDPGKSRQMYRRLWANHVRDPLIVAVIATGLMAAAHSPGYSRALARPLVELAIVWTAVAAIGVRGWQRQRSAADVENVTRAMADSLQGLDELRYAIDQAAIVATTDHRGIITYVNDKFCAISKYSRDELIGQDHRIINSGHHPKAFMRDLWRTIAQGGVWRGEIRNRAKDGSNYWVDTTIVPFLDGRGKPRQYLAIRSDITQRKDAEAQLRAQSALTHLGQLAAVVAHEVRNPLAGLRASLQILDRRFPSGAPDRDVIQMMIQRIDSLNEKVEDLLLYARPRSPRLQPVDVRTIAREAANGARAATGNHHPPIDILGDPAVAYADPDMLRAVLLNLLMNACQASATGGVDLQVTTGTGTCRIGVRDRGPGIPAHVSERVFEPFFTTREGGTGLGLAIVTRLLELQGGGVVLTDRPGGGTVAEVTVPAAPP